jgi:hypothetical protein
MMPRRSIPLPLLGTMLVGRMMIVLRFFTAAFAFSIAGRTKVGAEDAGAGGSLVGFLCFR